MKRVGERGEGKFEQISWDEALGGVAKELQRIKGIYGPSAILLASGSGSPGHIHSAAAMRRLLAMFGGYSTTWGGPSAEGSVLVVGYESAGWTIKHFSFVWFLSEKGLYC